MYCVVNLLPINVLCYAEQNEDLGTSKNES